MKESNRFASRFRRRHRALRLSIPVLFFGLSALLFPRTGIAETLTLQETIAVALDANIGMKLSKAESTAKESLRKASKAAFFPTFSMNYKYTYHDAERQSLGLLTQPKDEYQFSTSVTQPIFSGFAILNQYKLAELGLGAARIGETIERQRIIFDAQQAYFSVLRARKLVSVAEDAVASLQANLEVAKNFHDVGMIPYNDLLKAEVELANARQDSIVAKNSLEIARSNFNTLLRRPINAEVDLVDIAGYTPFARDVADCLSAAQENRPELKAADLQVEIAQKEIALARKDYYPTLQLQGTYYRQESGFLVGSGEPYGFITDPDGWDILAQASWNFWEWGKTDHGVREKLSRLSQARLQQTQLLDDIRLQVKQAYLRTKDSESNIGAVEKAVEQAKENLRITQERYKEQVATTQDVLDAQTLLSRTMTNYYSALYDFKISEASLYRAMGQENTE